LKSGRSLGIATLDDYYGGKSKGITDQRGTSD